jgi:phosphatidylglycerol:prolipoprotein diacylglycerol transferase
MHSVLLRIPLPWGPPGNCLPLPAYGTALMVGFLLAVWMARRRSRVLGLAPVEILDMGMFAIIGGVLGARVLYVVLYPGQFFYGRGDAGLLGWLGGSFLRVIATWNGGLAFYGGLVGGMLALWLYTRSRKIPFVDVLDFAAAPAAVGLAVTRVGCFMNGCCFGKPSNLPWAVRFPPDSPAQLEQSKHGLGSPDGFSLPVHPAQLYETLFGLTLAAFIWFAVYPRRKFAGQAACTFGVLYATWRFSNEFLRGDTFVNGPGGAGLSSFQYISLALIAAFAAAYFVARRVGRAPFVPPPPAPESEEAP